MDKQQAHHRADGTSPDSTPKSNVPNTEEQPSRLLDEKAEKYLRESGEIEDMPAEEDMEDYDDKSGR